MATIRTGADNLGCCLNSLLHFWFFSVSSFNSDFIQLTREYSFAVSWGSNRACDAWLHFWEWPHVKAHPDTNHQTTNSLSQPLYNSAAASESNPVQSTPESRPPSVALHMCTVIMGGWEDDPHGSRNALLHLPVLLGLKAAKPQTLNIYSVVSSAHLKVHGRRDVNLFLKGEKFSTKLNLGFQTAF